jgi:hypothetical protein
MGYTETYIQRQMQLIMLLGTKFGIRSANDITSCDTESVAVAFCVENPEFHICIRPVEPKVVPVVDKRLELSDFDF